MELLLAFLLGLGSSGIVAYVVYRRQRVESVASEKKLADLVQEALDNTTHLRFTIATVRNGQSELRNDVAKLVALMSESLAEPEPKGST
ncbi:MAG TPA: hypothetical protein VFO89_06930, partial [Thermoanaerobaculia bacterium]|nr:hypothetical protein [Thermoanaerobaculia bacterium]